MRRMGAAILIVGMAVGGLGVGCAKKQDAGSRDAVFMKYDINRNGSITKEEFVSQWRNKQKAETAWQQIDTKGNGYVDRVLANDIPMNVWDDVESQDDPY